MRTPTARTREAATDLQGRQFGEWTVVRDLGSSDDGRPVTRKVRCRCSCGLRRLVAAEALVSGRSTFCNRKSRHPRGEEPDTGQVAEADALPRVNVPRWGDDGDR